MPHVHIPVMSRPEGMPEHMAMIRLSALGDIVLTTGVLRHWYDLWGLTFTVITRQSFAPVFENHPAVTRVIGLEAQDLEGEGQKNRFRELARECSGIPLVDLHGTLRTRLLARQWQGSVHPYPKHSLARRLFLLSGGRFGGGILRRENVPQRYARALPTPLSLPIPQVVLPILYLTPEEKEKAVVSLVRTFPRLATTDDTAWTPHDAPVALHPFATHAGKTWPMETWLAFADLLDQNGIRHFWVGKRSDSIIPYAPNNFINRTDLRELAALLSQASVLVSGDSGPVHLASGVGTSVLALFGPTCREWGFFPAGEHDVVLQDDGYNCPASLHGKSRSRKNESCLAGLSPETVLAALRAMLEKRPGTPLFSS